MAQTVRFGSTIAVAWEDFAHMVAEADVPADTYVCAGAAGNLILVDRDGEYLAFIDHNAGRIDGPAFRS